MEQEANTMLGILGIAFALMILFGVLAIYTSKNTDWEDDEPNIK